MVRNRLPSGVCTMRQPKWLPLESGPSWRKITLHVVEPRRALVDQPRARQRRAAAAGRRLGEAEIDGAGSAQSRGRARRRAGRPGRARRPAARRRAAGDSLPSLADDAQAARPLGDQHAAVGQEGERPGMVQAAARRSRPPICRRTRETSARRRAPPRCATERRPRMRLSTISCASSWCSSLAATTVRAPPRFQQVARRSHR